MSIDDIKSPYYSTRVRISDITSPKAWIGYKERTIEIIYGNQESRKLQENPDDAGDDRRERSLKDDILKAFEETDEVAKIRGFKFADVTKKTEKGEPMEENKIQEWKTQTGIKSS